MDDSLFSKISAKSFYGNAKKKPINLKNEEINFELPDGSDLIESDYEDEIQNSKLQNNLEDNNFDSEDEIPLKQLISNKINKSKKNYKWCKNDSMYGPGTLPPFLGSEATNIQRNSSLEYFLSFFTEDIVENIVYQTNIYAAQNNKLKVGLTKKEFCSFLGIDLIMSYIKYPRLRFYWSSDEGLQINLIANSMSVNRYELILRYMHFIDWKKTSYAAEPKEYQSIDEQIIPLKGRLVRAGVSAYMNRFEEDLVHKNHKLFFDNLFCLIPLIEELKLRGIWTTGTLIRLNRLQNVKSSLKSDKDMKREDRGSIAVATMNLKISQSFRTVIQINGPGAVGFYNKNMGGVDLLDQLFALYPSRRRNKRWYIRVLMHFLDVVVVNAWILFKQNGNTKHDLLEFKTSVGRALINIGTNNVNRKDRPRSVTPPSILKPRKPNYHAPDKIRKDQFGHWPKLTDIKNARRCHSKTCSRKTKHICKRCNEPC
ncbi:hypothetical protein ILUMI_14540 [Ignelater luminosus]|uniref:PiggyBac transposable element-derived protein domain-containing protein n=1 Tax=Ignelater luminosus TaxID=2038154 RepID=A0A8K0CVS5_IGNLU|nr:hypothetical protein ILUMI_14540 [Ignelater luminosus]